MGTPDLGICSTLATKTGSSVQITPERICELFGGLEKFEGCEFWWKAAAVVLFLDLVEAI